MDYFDLIETPDYTIEGCRLGGDLCGFLTIEFTGNARDARVIPMTETNVLLVEPPTGTNTDDLKENICIAFKSIYGMDMVEQKGDMEARPIYEPHELTITVTGELTTEDPEDFRDSGRYTRYGDHTLFKDSDYGADTENVLAKLTGRLNHHNYYAVSDFWDCSYEGLREALERIDKDNDLAVVHRKCKDWYIYAPLIDHGESDYYDLPGMSDVDAYEEIRSTDNRDHSATVKEMAEMIESYRRDVEINGFINNQLYLDEYHDSTWYTLTNKDDLERYFEDIWDLRNQIQENWNWDSIQWGKYPDEDKSLEAEFSRIYQPLLKEAKAEHRKRKTDRLVERQYLWEKLKEFVGMKGDTTIIEADFLACF